MTIQSQNISVHFLILSVRYLLVSYGLRLIQAIVVLAALSFMLMGCRIASFDRYRNRADIAASIFLTLAMTALLAGLNRRVMTAGDRRFFRKEYNARQILSELGAVIPTLSMTKQLVELVADKIGDALRPVNVTIFLDDEDAGAYVVAFSSDAPKAGAALLSQPRSVVLRYDEGLINRLRKSIHLTTIDLSDADFLPSRPGLERDSVLSDHESRMLAAVRSSLLIPIASHGRFHGLISLQRFSVDHKELFEQQGNGDTRKPRSTVCGVPPNGL